MYAGFAIFVKEIFIIFLSKPSGRFVNFSNVVLKYLDYEFEIG